MKTKTKGQAKAGQKTLVCLLLDRTGSMADVKQETIGGFNGYLDELVKKPESEGIRFSFVQFDSISRDTIHKAVPLSKAQRLSEGTFQPRANTPLYDAIGQTIKEVELQVFKSPPKTKVLFVVLTDGHENASSKFTYDSVRALIKEKEDKDKWTFSYIGIGPDAWAQNAHLSVGTQGASNVLRATRGRNTVRAYSKLAGATMCVSASVGGQSVNSLYAGQHLDQDDDAK